MRVFCGLFLHLDEPRESEPDSQPVALLTVKLFIYGTLGYLTLVRVLRLPRVLGFGFRLREEGEL